MFETCIDGALQYLRCVPLSRSGAAVHGFPTRIGGVSTGDFAGLNFGFRRGDDPDCVRQNYRLFCGALGLTSDRLVFNKQIHSDNVYIVDEKDAGVGFSAHILEGDALVTACRNLPIACFYADCVPVLLLDPENGVIGAVHAGWRGTVSGILRKAVGCMEALGACPTDILAAVGPCIGACHFEVGEDVLTAASAAFGGVTAAELFLRRDGRFFMDLRAANTLLLSSAGVPAANVSVCPDCTYCHPGHYFSHRRDGDRRGVHMAVISLR